MTALLTLPIMVPLLGAGLSILLGGSRRAQRAVGLTSLTAVAGLAVALLVAVDRDGTGGDPGRRLAGAARGHAGRRPPVGDHAGGGRGDAAGRARVRHRPARRRAEPRRVPVGVPGHGRRRRRRVPGRRPVQPVRRDRDDADRQLRAHHARRPARPGARRHDLRRRQPARLVAVRDPARGHLRRHRHRQPGRPGREDRRPARRAPQRPGRAHARRVRDQGGDRARSSSGCPTATRPRRRRSRPSSPGCSPRSACTP